MTMWCAAARDLIRGAMAARKVAERHARLLRAMEWLHAAANDPSLSTDEHLNIDRAWYIVHGAYWGSLQLRTVGCKGGSK